MWRGAPLVLLLHPRRWYALDVVGVAILVGARHREPGDILELKDFHGVLNGARRAWMLRLWRATCLDAACSRHAAGRD